MVSSMDELRWIAFGLQDKNYRTAVHFFPYAGSISATYPVELSLSLFSDQFEAIQISMDGARLSQPDGLVLQDVFPALLKDFNGSFGIEIKISCSNQPHLDLSSSVCIIEMLGSNGSIKYEAKLVDKKQDLKLSAVLQNSQQFTTQLVAINSAETTKNSGLPARVFKSKETTQFLPATVQELSVADKFYDEAYQQNCFGGEVQINSIEINRPTADLIYYRLKRSHDGNIVSVNYL